jgi:hypothetical protein
MSAQTQAGSATIDRLIINSPYEEPREHLLQHWRDTEQRDLRLTRRGRRPRVSGEGKLKTEIPLDKQAVLT